MKWMEIIELRSIDIKNDYVALQLDNWLKAIEKEYKNQIFKAYKHFVVDSNYIIQLFHESDHIEQNGSQIGLQLLANLKSYGLVNHSIWIETNKKH